MAWAVRTRAIEATPSQPLVSGSSYGRLAAAYVAFRHPERFGAVRSQSGSFWWAPVFLKDKRITPEWLPLKFATAPVKSIRFYLNAGLFETGMPLGDILVSNRHLSHVLLAKGYEATYEEFASGHDGFSRQVTLPKGLIRLLGQPDSSDVPKAMHGIPGRKSQIRI